jgi:YegS/Rv2252/BmrU family lipid kinase
MKRAVVVINPLSGRGRYDNQIRAHAALAEQMLAAHDYQAWVRPTTGTGDARRFASEAVASGCDLVVAWGGDGTVNEVGSALVHATVPMAIVPAGSGNGLASDLLLPFDATQALQVAATGVTRRIDAGRVDDAWFFNIAGVGLDACIAAKFAERGLRRRGAITYLQLTTVEVLRYRPHPYAITCDGDTRTIVAMFIAVANGRQYGNRVIIAPDARLDDGQFELVVVEPQSLWAILRRLPALFRGRLRPGAGVTMRAGRELRIDRPGAIPYHVDGEPRAGRDTIRISMVPGALSVRTSVV